ncbi:hypothetical protein [Liquorilactobacillus satsumensis]|uniref:hypothetical protein n=1 Tax=Liquorilactobacillus satsumensis TaxID=259059 RepID=UPI0039ECCD6C
MNQVPERTFMQKYHLKGIGWTIIFILLLFLSSVMTEVNWGEFFSNLGQFFALLGRMGAVP